MSLESTNNKTNLYTTLLLLSANIFNELISMCSAYGNIIYSGKTFKNIDVVIETGSELFAGTDGDISLKQMAA